MGNGQADTVNWVALRARLARYMPADLFERLRAFRDNLESPDAEEGDQISATLRRAIRVLEPLHRVLINYMPRYLIELDSNPGQPHGELLEGSFIHADLKGFTALTELMVRQGSEQGQEAMNRMLNRLFSGLLDPLVASGGDLLIFAGDAILAYFPAQDDGGDVLQAVRASLRMERAIVPFSTVENEFGACQLAMRIGVERGLAYAGVVGSRQRMELLVSGPGIEQAMKAESQSEPGEVRVGEGAKKIAGPHFTFNGDIVVDDLGDDLGDYEVQPPKRRRGGGFIVSNDISELLSALDTTLKRVEQLAPFVPEDVLAHLVNVDRRRKLVVEFRPVAVQFLQISGLEALALNEGVAKATSVFQRFFVRAQEIVQRHEGIISQIDAYPGGFFLLNTFGTPRVHEGTTRYAVSAALQLAEALAQVNREFRLDPPLRQRGGITYGRTFNGEIGAQYRREAVIAGPSVNRASRLMGKAEAGQVILDADIWAQTESAFVGQRLSAVTLKGIDNPVVIVNVQELRRGSRLQAPARPVLGREAELACLIEGLTASTSGSGGAWLLSGETGIGKTSLAATLARQARAQNLTTLVGRCQPHGKHIPFFPWIDLLTGWLDFDERASKETLRDRLQIALRVLGLTPSADALVNLLDLAAIEVTEAVDASLVNDQSSDFQASLGRKLGLDSTPSGSGSLDDLLSIRTTQTAESGQTLWDRLETRVSQADIILGLLKKLVANQPLLIVLEDIHWLDDESLALLKRLVREMNQSPLMVLLTGREPIEEWSGLTALPLRPLPATALAGVVGRAFGAESVEPALVEWVLQRAGGNPLYAEVICQALQNADAIMLDRQSGEVRRTELEPAIPLQLHELLLSRFDALPQLEQEILKRAAVMGLSFSKAGLLALVDDNLMAQNVPAALDTVIRSGFISGLSDETYAFTHQLMQEAIYTTLSFAQRQDWHTHLGDWLATTGPDTDRTLELAAYHYLKGSDAEKGARFGLKAADRAKRRGAYAGAIDYYRQVFELPAAPVGAKERAAEGWAAILSLQGQPEAARAIRSGAPHST
jgi:class 3 adenylate cyclase